MKNKKTTSRKETKLTRNVLYFSAIIISITLIILAIFMLGERKTAQPSQAQSVISKQESIELSASPTEEIHAPTPTLTPTITKEVQPTPKPTQIPTIAPVELASLSTKKLGWAYSPGGKTGVPATNTESRIKMCEKFDCIWQGDTTQKKIYITMDIGYEYNNNTIKILDIAKEKDFKMTFFIVGKQSNYDIYTKLLKRIHAEGHIAASHSWNHPFYDNLYRDNGRKAIEEDLKKAEDIHIELTGFPLAKYFRFPSGEYSEAAMYVVRQAGYKSVFWSFAYRDWLIDDQPNPEESLNKIINNLHNGAVLLLHTVSNTNVQILPELVDEIRARGYEIALISDIK